jgi:hypothetical protein
MFEFILTPLDTISFEIEEKRHYDNCNCKLYLEEYCFFARIKWLNKNNKIKVFKKLISYHSKIDNQDIQKYIISIIKIFLLNDDFNYDDDENHELLYNIISLTEYDNYHCHQYFLDTICAHYKHFKKI